MAVGDSRGGHRRKAPYRRRLQKALPHKQPHLLSNSSEPPHSTELINVYYGNYTNKRVVIIHFSSSQPQTPLVIHYK